MSCKLLAPAAPVLQTVGASCTSASPYRGQSLARVGRGLDPGVPRFAHSPLNDRRVPDSNEVDSFHAKFQRLRGGPWPRALPLGSANGHDNADDLGL